jgi:hypothetical protein
MLTMLKFITLAAINDIHDMHGGSIVCSITSGLLTYLHCIHIKELRNVIFILNFQYVTGMGAGSAREHKQQMTEYG